MALNTSTFDAFRAPKAFNLVVGLSVTFLRVDIEDPGCGGGGSTNKPLWCHHPSMDTILPDNSHPVLQTIHTIGDLGEVIDTHGLLLGVEGAVVSSCALKLSTSQQLGNNYIV